MGFLDYDGLRYFYGKVLARIKGLTAEDVGAATPSYVDEQIAALSELGVSKLNVDTKEQTATTEGQTVFPILTEGYNAASDTVKVYSGRTTLSPISDYTINGSNVVLNEGVPLGRTITMDVFRNVLAGDAGAVNGSSIAVGTIPLDRLEEIPECSVTSDTPIHLSINANGGLTITYDDGSET